MTPDELKSQFDAINAEVAQNLLKRDEAIKAAGVETAAIKTEFKSTFDNLRTQIDNIRAEMLKPHQDSPIMSGKSLGQQFIESDAFKQYKSRAWHKGGASFNLEGQPIVERKTTITSAAVGSSTPGILVPQRLPGIVKPPVEQIRDRKSVV